MNIKIFADGANLNEMIEIYRRGEVQGFTTNPTLMRKAGVSDYEAFARSAIEAIPDAPISLEVFADDFPTMARQAKRIASWGGNVYVKVPIVNTLGESSVPLIRSLAEDGCKLNVTAILTLDQVARTVEALNDTVPAIVSIFAGRIADTGRDPVPVMRAAVAMASCRPLAEVLWASPREVLNIYQADETGCQIITVTGDLLKKLPMRNKNLDDLTRDTVSMFRNDALHAGYELSV